MLEPVSPSIKLRFKPGLTFSQRLKTAAVRFLPVFLLIEGLQILLRYPVHQWLQVISRDWPAFLLIQVPPALIGVFTYALMLTGVASYMTKRNTKNSGDRP